jgi:hypothetical protein
MILAAMVALLDDGVSKERYSYILTHVDLDPKHEQLPKRKFRLSISG